MNFYFQAFELVISDFVNKIKLKKVLSDDMSGIKVALAEHQELVSTNRTLNIKFLRLNEDDILRTSVLIFMVYHDTRARLFKTNDLVS